MRSASRSTSGRICGIGGSSQRRAGIVSPCGAAIHAPLSARSSSSNHRPFFDWPGRSMERPAADQWTRTKPLAMRPVRHENARALFDRRDCPSTTIMPPKAIEPAASRMKKNEHAPSILMPFELLVPNPPVIRRTITAVLKKGASTGAPRKNSDSSIPSWPASDVISQIIANNAVPLSAKYRS